jgi:dihydrofolate synthase/folylpolyglutamate synthase
MFSRIGAAALKPDLNNTLALCEILGNPQQSIKCIHIAGTNGKGSTSHLLASVLQEAGYKTGLYTSPHLVDFRERIQVNGQYIPQDYVTDFVEKYRSAFEDIQPSFFEWTLALCFEYFKHEQVDIAIIETGLGGRLDSTNVITPLLSIITNIGWDHTDLLGDTLEKIAIEKAGIIKKNVPILIGEKQPETTDVFIRQAHVCNADIVFVQDETTWVHFETHSDGGVSGKLKMMHQELVMDIDCPLGGIYQQHNIPTVIAACQRLRKMAFDISWQHMQLGIQHVIQNTRFKGRWQMLGKQPTIVCDTAHNINGIGYVVQQLKQQKYHQLHMVMGMVKDKDIHAVLALLPTQAKYYFCNAQLPRALPAEDLANAAAGYHLKGHVYSSVVRAFEEAKLNAGENDFIFIGGSTFVVAEILEKYV